MEPGPVGPESNGRAGLPGADYAGDVKFLLVAIVFGVAIYLLVRAVQRRGSASRRPPGGTAGGQARRPVAPDDDPDFLREIERQKRKKKRQDDPES